MKELRIFRRAKYGQAESFLAPICPFAEPAIYGGVQAPRIHLDVNKMADERTSNVFVRFVSALAQITSGTSSNTEELGGRLLSIVRESPICRENNENLDKIRRLVQKGASVNFQARDSNYTALHFACLNSDYHAAQALIALGADVNCGDSQKSTPLHLVCRQKGSCELCKLLLVHGTEVNARNSFGITPLHYAAATPEPQTIELLINHGASWDIHGEFVPSSAGKLPETPFAIAIRCGLVENIMIFLKNGASFNKLSAPVFLLRAYHQQMKQSAARCFIEVGMHRSTMIADYHVYREKFVNWPDELKALLTQPKSLSGSCVQVIRDILGPRNFSSKVCFLALPETQQNKILYWDFDKIGRGGSTHSIYEMVPIVKTQCHVDNWTGLCKPARCDDFVAIFQVAQNSLKFAMSTHFVLKNVPVFVSRRQESMDKIAWKSNPPPSPPPPPPSLSLSPSPNTRISILESQSTVHVFYAIVTSGRLARTLSIISNL